MTEPLLYIDGPQAWCEESQFPQGVDLHVRRSLSMFEPSSEPSLGRYEPAGWMHWPGHPDHCFEFMRVLGRAQEGASTISECFLTATRIQVGDDESWHREWKRIGDINKTRGDAAFRNGHIETAKWNWLRASNYHRTAQCFQKPGGERYLGSFNEMENCSRLYLKHLTPPGEVVQIPYECAKSLWGYFLRAPNAPTRSPVVLCFGGLDEFKDDQLYDMPRHAFARGLSLLLVDLPGQGATATRSGLAGRHDQEVAISYCMDYLLAQNGVDHKRIVLYGDGLGGAYASRAASLDDRFAAAICDGGIWDQIERRYLVNSLCYAGEDNRLARLTGMSDGCFASRIKCPYLVTVGEHGFLEVDTATDLYERSRRSDLKTDFRVFSAEETGASHCQADNPTLGREFIFDWIISQIGKGGR